MSTKRKAENELLSDSEKRKHYEFNAILKSKVYAHEWIIKKPKKPKMEKFQFSLLPPSKMLPTVSELLERLDLSLFRHDSFIYDIFNHQMNLMNWQIECQLEIIFLVEKVYFDLRFGNKYLGVRFDDKGKSHDWEIYVEKKKISRSESKSFRFSKYQNGSMLLLEQRNEICNFPQLNGSLGDTLDEICNYVGLPDSEGLNLLTLILKIISYGTFVRLPSDLNNSTKKSLTNILGRQGRSWLYGCLLEKSWNELQYRYE